ncbi:MULTISPECIES: hypothetical protein [Paracoccus]|nr:MULTISPECIES: hypothetical protein [Paracoccus]
MTRPIAMARFDLAWPLAGAFAAVLSALALGVSSALRGLPVWMPLNATTHALHGPAAATTTAFDLTHTGLGAAIHVVSCFFWAAVAVLLIRKAARGGAAVAWLTGLATATIAGLIDYGLMPARLRPGWELVLSPLGVIAGLVALGVGLSLGLIAAQAMASRAPGTSTGLDRYPPVRNPTKTSQVIPDSALDRLRQPAPDVLDQRQQRVDPAGAVTDDPNRHGNGNKQPGQPAPQERPDR